MPRLYRASLLGAAALPVAALTYAVVASVWNAHRCGMHPLDRLGCEVIRRADAWWESHAQHF